MKHKKKILAAFLLLFSWGMLRAEVPRNESIETKVHGDTITLDHLVGMDKKKFRGKTLAEFLDSPEAKGYQNINYRLNEDGSLQAIKLEYSNKLLLNVYLKDLQFTGASSAFQELDLEQLRKKAIEDIRVVYVMYDNQ